MELLFGIIIVWLIGYTMGRNSVLREQRKAETAILVEDIQSEAATKPEPVLQPKTADTAQKPVAEPRPSLTPIETPIVAHREFKPIDSVSTLLYFGAFLMVASVGLFVGLSEFSGAVKTVAVLLLALTFYSAGLYIFTKSTRLRPAAIAFTAIGLISLPLTGVAAYAYLTDQQYGPLIWCLTSVACLALYIVALWKIRQSLMGYLSVFMGLSLWMSVVAVIEAPVYFFAWAMVIISAISVAATKYLHLWREVEEPLTTSASVMVPATLLITVLFGGSAVSLTDQGITLLLGACFYAVATWTEPRPQERSAFFILGYILLPLGAAYLAHGLYHDWVVTAYTVTFVLIAQIAGLASFKNAINPKWLQGGLAASAFGLVGAAVVCAATLDWQALAWLVGMHCAAYGFVALYLHNKMHAFLLLASSLILPGLVGFLALQPAAPRASIVAAYILLGFALMGAGHLARRSFADYTGMLLTSYWAAWLLAWAIGAGSHGDLPAMTSLAVAVSAIASTYYERRPAIAYAAAIAGVVGAIQFLSWHHMLQGSNFALFVGGLGAFYYVAGILQQRLPQLKQYYEPWALSGVVVLYIGSVYSLLLGGTQWAGICVLALAGATTAYEAHKRYDKPGTYVGAAVMLVAVEIALYHIGFREWQVYWYLWSAYALSIAYLESQPHAIAAGASIAAVGAMVGLAHHQAFTLINATLVLLTISAALYGTGKIHTILGGQLQQFAQTWTYSGLAGLYATAMLAFILPSNGSGYLANGLALMAAGALTTYEAYRQRNSGAQYLGGAVTLIGLQWLMQQNEIHEVQLYTHMWAGYFALLAWLSHRNGRDQDKQSFTVLALFTQTSPLALQALSGDAGYGLLLLLESTGIMLLGLWLRYSLVRNWGLAVAVGSVLYQLREFQFFVLALLGAGVIGVGVYLLIKNDRTKKP